MSWHDGQLLGFDLETTDKDPMVAVPVSYGFALRRDAHRMSIQKGLIDPGIDIPAEATEIHGITNEQVRADGEPLAAAMVVIVDRLLWAIENSIPLVGMNVSYDLTIVHRLTGALIETPKVLDVFVLDKQLWKWRKGSRRLSALVETYGAFCPELEAHEAGADAIAALLVLDGMVKKWPWLAFKPIDKLHRYQEKAWADQQRSSLSEYFVEQGQDPIPWEDYGWPIKRAALKGGDDVAVHA